MSSKEDDLKVEGLPLPPRTDFSDLPDFARQWMAQWRSAGTELPKIRDQELRRIGESNAIETASYLGLLPQFVEDPDSNGLVIQQRWFMRQRLLQLEAKEASSHGASASTTFSD
jgi:hypothetical protein